MSSKVRRFIISGLDAGYPIEPYIVETDYRGDIDHHLKCYGDCARYYEELTEGNLEMRNKYMVYLSFKGVYDNGHDFLAINPNYDIETHDFETLKEAIDFAKSKEADYKDLMINSITRFKKENKYFKAYNVDAFIMGYVSLEAEDGDELDQWDVFFHKYEPEQELTESEGL